jgi:hypothetical protein
MSLLYQSVIIEMGMQLAGEIDEVEERNCSIGTLSTRNSMWITLSLNSGLRMKYCINIMPLKDTVTLNMEAVGSFETLVLSIKLHGLVTK